MKDSEIKIRLFQQIDSLETDHLMELYGVIKNFLNRNDDITEWEKLTSRQKKGIEYGISEMNDNKGVEHELVIENIRNKYGIS